MYWTYVLWSEKLKKRYVGFMGKSPEERLDEHNHGKTPFTHKGTPWKLIHTEKYSSLSEARSREKFLKTGACRKWLDERVPDPE